MGTPPAFEWSLPQQNSVLSRIEERAARPDRKTGGEPLYFLDRVFAPTGGLAFRFSTTTPRRSLPAIVAETAAE
jgi:hypothetical protein